MVLVELVLPHLHVFRPSRKCRRGRYGCYSNCATLVRPGHLEDLGDMDLQVIPGKRAGVRSRRGTCIEGNFRGMVLASEPNATVMILGLPTNSKSTSFYLRKHETDKFPK